MEPISRNLMIIDPKILEADHAHQLISESSIELVALSFQSDLIIDIGAMCYAGNLNTKRSSIRLVSSEDFRPERKKPLKQWLIAKTIKFYHGQRIATFYGGVTIMRHFISWSDANGYHNVLATAEAYKSALQNYCLSMQPEVNNGKLDKKTGRLKQRELQKSGRQLFPNTSINFETDMPAVWSESSNANPTPTPSEADFGETIAMCMAIFEQFTHFLVNGLKFPFEVTFPNTSGVLTASEYILITPTVANSRKARSSVTWDYSVPRIRSYGEIVALSKGGTKSVAGMLTKAHKLQANANDDLFHTTRRWILQQAHDAFLTLFVANTGINESPAKELPWSDDYTIEDDEQVGFAAIKYRANGKSITLSIRKSFIPLFRKYLVLRKFLSKHFNGPNLFFHVDGNNGKVHSVLRNSGLIRFGYTVRTFIDPNYPMLNYRELRKYKTVYLLMKGYSVPVVASVMQNSPQTVAKSYSDINERSGIDEIYAMLTLLLETLENYEHKETPAGACRSIDDPLALRLIPVGYEPNCKDFSSCIFCHHFGTHVNEDGIRKILSMRYVIQERLTLCTDVEHFVQVHGDAINRIDLIMASLLDARPGIKALVDKVSSEIENEYKLTGYWNRQLYRIQKLRGVE
jgi:hypothetical protein